MNEFDVDLEELSREELTSAEVREILDRLSVQEFGTPERATVAAVCESANADILVVARILREIRQRNLQDLFGSRLDKHEQEIERHEVRLDEHGEELGRLATRSGQTREVDKELKRMAEERIRERRYEPIFGVITVVLFFAYVVFVITDIQRHRREPAQGPIGPFSRPRR